MDTVPKSGVEINGKSGMNQSFGPLIIKSFTPTQSHSLSTSPRSYGRRGLRTGSGTEDQPDFGLEGSPVNFQQLQRPSTTGSYTTTSSRLKQKKAMLAYQRQVGSLPRGWEDHGTVTEEQSVDMIPSDSSVLVEDSGGLSLINNSDIGRVEHVVDAWLEQFIEDIAPQFPRVTGTREFAMRILNVILERNLLRETRGQPNRLVTMEDKASGPEEMESTRPCPDQAVSVGGVCAPAPTSNTGTQTLLHRVIQGAQVSDQSAEIGTLRSKIQKMDAMVKKQNGHITLKELEKVKLEKEVKELKGIVAGCWCCTNPVLRTPQNRRRASVDRPGIDHRPQTSMGFVRTPATEGVAPIKERQDFGSVPPRALETKFNESRDLNVEFQESDEKGRCLKDGSEIKRERVRKDIKKRQFGGAGSPIFDIQVRAGQSLNNKLRSELVALRARVQEMVAHVENENSKSVQSLLETKARLQAQAQKLEVGLDNNHELNNRVAKEVQKRVLMLEEDAKVLLKQQEDELVRLRNRVHSETREKRKQLTSARKENEKKEELIIQSQDDRIKKMRYQIQSKEHNMMQKQVMMEQENRAVLQELDEKCLQTEKLDKENHDLKQKILKLEERIQQEQHKFNLQKIELNDLQTKAKSQTSASHGLQGQYESLKADLQEARLTAEEYINKFNLSTYQIEQLEKSKWFMDKHMKRLKRDIDELEEQHKATMDELIQMRSQCSYLLRDNSKMKVAVQEGTRAIASCNKMFHMMNDKVAFCEGAMEDSSSTLEVMDDCLEKDQMRLGREYKALCGVLGKDLKETKEELRGANSARTTMNESIKKLSLHHARRKWRDGHMDYHSMKDEFKEDGSKQLVSQAEEMQNKTLTEASELDATDSLDKILTVVRESNDLRLNLGEECIRIATTNKVGSSVMSTLGAFYNKLFRDLDNLIFRTDKKLKSFERKEGNLHKRVVIYAEKMKALRVYHNQEVHEKNKKIKDIDKSLNQEKMRVTQKDHTISDLREDMKSKDKQLESLTISADTLKMSKERLTKELTLSRIKVKRLEGEITEKDSLVHKVQMDAAEYQVHVNVNSRKFDQRLDHFKGWLGTASEQLGQRMVSIKEDFSYMQDDILHELLKTKAYIEYELSNENSFLAKLKLKDWESGKR